MIESFKNLTQIIARKDKRDLILLFFLMLLGTILELAGVGIIPVFIGLVADPEGMQKIPVMHSFLGWIGLVDQRKFFIYGGLMVMAMFILKNGFIIGLYRFKVIAIQSVQLDLEKRLFSAYLNMSYLNHVKSNSTQLLRNLTTEINILIVNFLFPVMQVFMDLLLSVFIITLLIWSNFAATMIILGGLGVLGGIFFFFTKKSIKKYGVQELDNRGKKIKTISQSFNGIKEIKVLNRENYFYNEFVLFARLALRASRYMRIINALPKPVIETLAVIGLLGISMFMFSQGTEFTKLLPTIALFTVAFVKLMPAFRTLIEGINSIRYYKSSIGVVANDLIKYETENKKTILQNSSTPIVFYKQLEIKDLIFKYPKNEKNILNKINLKINKGEVTGIVGTTGSGKTTMIDLILGLFKPIGGDILVDDTSVFENLPVWQKKVGYIPQNIHLNDDTIKKNIAFGVPDEQIDKDSLAKAVNYAQLEPLVNRLPEGLETIIGERGVRLSGGERQRIGIARAIYNNPDLLIMDEATSSLDNLTEKYIVDAINALRGKMTIIVIAHRLQTITNCDIIYFLKDGKVADSGTYNKLSEENPDFRKMALIND
jgi:ATP-binding cassette, subfamily B, bacterial PglK